MAESGGLKDVLAKAAQDPAFLQVLIINRAATLAAYNLQAHEKTLLLNASAAQIRRMAAEAAKHQPTNLTRKMKMAAYVVTGAAVLALLYFVPSLFTDATPDTRNESRAQTQLQMIVDGQRSFKQKFGRYGTLDELQKQGYANPSNATFDFEVDVAGDSFVARARVKGTRSRGYQMDASGTLRPMR